MQARVAVDGRELGVDLSSPADLALALDFAGPQPRTLNWTRTAPAAYGSPDWGVCGRR